MSKKSCDQVRPVLLSMKQTCSTHLDEVFDVEFQQDDPVHREEEHEVPRVLLAIDHLGVGIQEVGTHFFERCKILQLIFPPSHEKTRLVGDERGTSRRGCILDDGWFVRRPSY
jgi:hypothetical protein